MDIILERERERELERERERMTDLQRETSGVVSGV